MGDVVTLNCITSLDVPADRVLEAAIGELDKVVLLGYAKDGSEYFASSISDGGGVLWLLERCKQELFVSTKREGQ